MKGKVKANLNKKKNINDINYLSSSDSENITTDQSQSSNIGDIDNNFCNWSEMGDQNGLLKVNDRSFSVDCSDTFNIFRNESLLPQRYPTSRDLKLKYTKHHDDILLKRKISKTDIKNKISICLSNTKYESVRRVAKQLEYKVVKESDFWNILWTDSTISLDLCKDMRRFQKINHFPGMFEICRKDLLARNLNRMLRMFPLDYQIFPKTWCFPADLGEAIAYSKVNKNKTYILKPDQGAQGRGIWITKNLREIKPTDRMICQLYINKPLLIDGFKFDLRVYTLVTSTDPLRIFVYNEGLARFATSKYKEPQGHNTTNMFMHLTNYSVNKHSRTYSIDDECGSKRKFSAINKILSDEGYDIVELWSNIDDIIVKTILSAWPMLKHNYNACFPSHDLIQACFEILGIDILIDHKLKPYILEINHSPSFHTNELIDREVKEAVLRDTFAMLNISNNDKKRVLDEDKKRVKSRLLQRIRDHSKDSTEKLEAIDLNNATAAQIIEKKTAGNFWATQIQWEEKHIGGYRRIMPAPGDPNKYTSFFILQNQASVYSDTAASKRREECSKQLRKELADKIVHEQLLCGRQKYGVLKSITEEDDKFKRRKKKMIIVKDLFQIEPISESDERDRTQIMAQRDFLVRSCGLVHNIIVSFYRNNLLTISDRKKYKDVFAKIAENDGKTININEHETNLEQRKLKLKSIVNTVTLGMNCTEAQINVLPPIPFLSSQHSAISANYRMTKATIARQVTNCVRRHNIESREFWTDKII